MHRDFQNIINGAYHALHHESSSPSPWTYHWENSHGAGTAQYWLPDQASPTGDIPRNPYPEYREACTRGHQSGAHVPGLWRGRVHGLRDGWHEGYQQGAWEGPGFQRGFGHGGFNGGWDGYGDGYDDYYDGLDDDVYDEYYGYGARGGYGGFGGGGYVGYGGYY